jgi:hypothetical protein
MFQKTTIINEEDKKKKNNRNTIFRLMTLETLMSVQCWWAQGELMELCPGIL